MYLCFDQAFFSPEKLKVLDSHK